MKAIIIFSLFVSFFISSSDITFVDNKKDSNENNLTASEEVVSISPQIIGPTEVDFATQVTWYASPNDCTCSYTWYMTDSMPFNYSTDGVGGPDGSGFLFWIVGIGPSDADFFFQLKITDHLTITDYYSNPLLITVNP